MPLSVLKSFSYQVIIPSKLVNFVEVMEKTDKIIVIGSCFATNVGQKLLESGYDVTINPFGTLFNPQSIAGSIRRLESAEPFTIEDCVEMGAGAGKICSFWHHTSFARPTAEEFLENANARLSAASEAWKRCNKVIVTFGTAQVWRHGGRTVSNCLKRPGYEFTHEMLTLDEIGECIRAICVEGKDYVFTVSPVRHLGEGAHVNTISKSLLHIALRDAGVNYFPAYEIVLDELRDYRYFNEDKVHPSQEAIEIVYKRFTDQLNTVFSPHAGTLKREG